MDILQTYGPKFGMVADVYELLWRTLQESRLHHLHYQYTISSEMLKFTDEELKEYAGNY